MRKDSLSSLLEPIGIGEARSIWVIDVAMGKDIQRRVLAKSRYPKEIKGRQFTTKLCVMHPINNCLEVTFWVLIERVA